MVEQVSSDRARGSNSFLGKADGLVSSLEGQIGWGAAV